MCLWCLFSVSSCFFGTSLDVSFSLGVFEVFFFGVFNVHFKKKLKIIGTEGRK